MSGNIFLVAIICAIALAAIGMKIAGGTPWKGALLGAIFIGASFAASTVADSLALSILGGAILAALVANAMKIPSRQAANALVGCVLGHFAPLLFL